jgi:ABC-type sugar transport system ATPase subunit
MSLRDLTVAQRQFIEIAKALSMKAKIIVMDEPTSVLTMSETKILFNLIRELKKQGSSVIYISHRMEELYEISDRCTVLKDGQYVGAIDTKDANNAVLIKMMTGRQIQNIYPEKAKEFGSTVLSVNGLTRNKVFKGITFDLHEKEVIGMAGLVGSGRSEIARAIFGIDKIDKGRVIVNGEKIEIKNPSMGLNNGIVYITEDRKGNGLFLDMSISNNITVSTMKRWTWHGIIQKRKERNIVQDICRKLGVKCSDSKQRVGNLSGGNQQKVMIARGLLSNAKIVIFDEPTRGVDVGTKTEIYKIIRSISEEGKAVIMISSELPEVIGMSDRILVMYHGTLAGILDNEDITEEKILSCATGGN